jgi:hypothetical protein
MAVGVEARFFGGRLKVSLEYFLERLRHLLGRHRNWRHVRFRRLAVTRHRKDQGSEEEGRGDDHPVVATTIPLRAARVMSNIVTSFDFADAQGCARAG